jgi:beta-glucanase (GH16 family)
VWSDEFDGTALDTAKWHVKTGASSVDRGCNVNGPANVFVSGGTLTLRALRQDATCGGEQRHFTEGYLDTIGRSSFTYGRFEVRARPPGSTGLWPAFWLRPEDGGNGEIDVTELPGGAAYNRAATQAIFHDYKPTKQDNRWTFPAGAPGDGFHIYTTDWEPGSLTWYVDGVQVYHRDRTTTSWFDEVFTKPYNLRLNLQAGGWLGDPDAGTPFPGDFVVDYVRVWQH